jgi:LPPG:FO 2-phospho-L-lactate transferase
MQSIGKILMTQASSVTNKNYKVAALAGGVGGAKLAHGLSALLPADRLTIIVNTGDDMDYMGLKICADVDTVLYTLSGKGNPHTGWGLAGDSFVCLHTLQELGAETWFNIGDKDFATHITRTAGLKQGKTLTQVTADLAHSLGIFHPILPMSNAPYPTLLETDQGLLDFQTYFVRLQCQPAIRHISWNHGQPGTATPEVLAALQAADCIIFCPSNPFVSLDPILSLPGVRELVSSRYCMALSPIINGKTVKGPAAKMFTEMGYVPSAATVAGYYRDLINHFFLDETDRQEVPAVEQLGMRCSAIPSFMPGLPERIRTARLMLDEFEKPFESQPRGDQL